MSAERAAGRGLLGVLRRASGSERSIFFSRFSIAAAIAVVLMGIAADERGITMAGVFVGLAAAVTWAWNRATVAGLRYGRTFSADRLFPGDVVEMTISIVNEKPLPVPWLTVDEELSDGLRLIDRESFPAGATGRRTFQLRTRLGPYERVTWRIPVECPVRGWHAIGPTTIRAGDPLGFFSNRSHRPDSDSLIVYPRIETLPNLRLPSRHAVGDVRVPRQLFVDPLRVIGIRDYRPEDPFKAIHWKASARQGRLQVRVAEPTTTMQLTVFANIDTFERYWEGLDIETSERVIEIAASLAVWALDHRYVVGVTSNAIAGGSDQPLRIPARRGTEQRLRVLEGLAKLSPYSTTPFLACVQAGAGRLAPGSTIAVVTSLLPDGLDARMQALIQAGQRVVLIPVGECPAPAIRGLIVRRIEPGIESTAGAAAHG